MLTRVFLAVRYILDRLSGPRSRADEVHDVRRRLAAQDGPKTASRCEAELARRLRGLREQMAAELGPAQACAHCDEGRWPGGQCCSARTRDLFSDDELAALKLGGTRAVHLKPAHGGHRGCAFRGPSGCSLVAAHRPSVCVGYACRDLLVELHRGGQGAANARLQDELGETFRRFAAERAARRKAALFDELRAGLLARARERRTSRGRLG
jgi:hypothetical protein